MKKMIISFIFLLLLMSIHFDMSFSGEEIIDPMTTIYIFPTGIGIPPGRLLLTRNGNEYCAVKIVKVEDRGEKDYAKSRALVEAYYQGDQSGDFLKPNVKYQKSKIGPIRVGGCMPLDIHYLTGESIKCGTYNLFWIPPVNINFPFGKELREKIEFAPTNWEDISEINLSDPRLRWYRYGRRPVIKIPMKEYWGESEK